MPSWPTREAAPRVREMTGGQRPRPGPAWKGRIQELRLTAFNEGSAPSSWRRGEAQLRGRTGESPPLSKGAAGAAPPGPWLLVGAGLPPASPPHFCSTDETQPGGSHALPAPCHTAPPALPTHHPGRETGPRPRRNLGAGAGVRGGGAGARGRARWTAGDAGTLTILGEEQGVVLRQVGTLDPLLKHTQE